MNQENDNSKKIARHIASIMLGKESDHKAEFDQWLTTNPLAVDTLSELTDETQLEHEVRNFSKIDKIAGAQKVLQRVARKKRITLLRRSVALAAAMIAVSFLVWQITPKVDPVSRTNTMVAASGNDTDVKLILEDGEVININQDTIEAGGVALYKCGENELALSVRKKKSGESSQMRLVVPRMNRYSIVLSDGTKVVLNAESELLFPDEFSGNCRQVRLKGEGYFEVAEDKKNPFIVLIDSIKVQVYGTKFNVNGFSRSNVTTFLLEGSVEVSFENGMKKMLEPNQLIQINQLNGENHVATVMNGVKYLAWVNNLFLFESETLEHVIGELSRWYNVEITSVGEMNPDIAISGTFKRSLNLDSILESIEIISGVQLLKTELPID